MSMSKRYSLLHAAALVTGISILGKFLGFIRDLLIAQHFGASSETDAFMVAGTMPETIGSLVLEGVAILVLVPLFARELEARGTLREFVARSLLPAIVVLLILTAGAVLAAPW